MNMKYYELFIHDGIGVDMDTLYEGFDKSEMEKAANSALADFKRECKYLEKNKDFRKWEFLPYGSDTNICCHCWNLPDDIDTSDPDEVREALEDVSFGDLLFKYDRFNYDEI